MHHPFVARAENTPSAFTPIGHGFNSCVYRYGDSVVKIAKRSHPLPKAEQRLERAREEYERIAEYLGPLIVSSKFHLGHHQEKPGEYMVVTVQPFIDGTPIADSRFYSRKTLRVMYERALDMYDDTGTVPDLACIEHGFFNPLHSPNVLVTQEGQPLLVDVNGGRLQSSRVFGPLWNFWISEGIKRALMDPKLHTGGSMDTE